MFPCTQCGACCIVAGLKGLMPQREDGACIHLTEDNLCEIYDDRPDFCRIDDAQKMVKETKNMTKRNYYKLSAELCNGYQEGFGIGEEYRVCLEETSEK